MGAGIKFKEGFDISLDIALGCGKGTMPEKLLDRTEICTSFQKMGRIAMAEEMGMGKGSKAKPSCSLLQDPLHPPRGEP
jgi:hypothetical protein